MVLQQRLSGMHEVLGSIRSTVSKTSKIQPTTSIFQILLGDTESISRELVQMFTVVAKTGNKTNGHPRDVTRWPKPTCWSAKGTDKLEAGAGEVIYRI